MTTDHRTFEDQFQVSSSNSTEEKRLQIFRRWAFEKFKFQAQASRAKLKTMKQYINKTTLLSPTLLFQKPHLQLQHWE